MLRTSINFHRMAALLALFGILLLNAPHADACQDGEACCTQSSTAGSDCAVSSTDGPKNTDGSGSLPAGSHVFCCMVHHVMIALNAPADFPFVLVGAMEISQTNLNPLFAVDLERPPKLA